MGRRRNGIDGCGRYIHTRSSKSNRQTILIASGGCIIHHRKRNNIRVLLRGVQRTEIERGQVLAAPGSIKPHTKFKSEVYVLKKEEGGRHTPFFNGYRPQFYFRTTDVTGD